MPSEQPPEREGQRSFPMNWPATIEWKETPVVISDGQHEVLKECAYALPQNLAVRLQTAHDAPGSLYVAGLEYLFALFHPPSDYRTDQVR